jgi:hypothetical protein
MEHEVTTGCSYTTTGITGQQQELLSCRTCAAFDVCSRCVERCHAGHHVSVTAPRHRHGYCMCGAGVSCCFNEADASAGDAAASQRLHESAEALCVFGAQLLLTGSSHAASARWLQTHVDAQGGIPIEQLTVAWEHLGWPLFSNASTGQGSPASARPAAPSIRTVIRALQSSLFLRVLKAGSLRARVTLRHPRADLVLQLAARHMSELTSRSGVLPDSEAQAQLAVDLCQQSTLHPAVLLLTSAQLQSNQHKEGGNDVLAAWQSVLQLRSPGHTSGRKRGREASDPLQSGAPAAKRHHALAEGFEHTTASKDAAKSGSGVKEAVTVQLHSIRDVQAAAAALKDAGAQRLFLHATAAKDSAAESALRSLAFSSDGATVYLMRFDEASNVVASSSAAAASSAAETREREPSSAARYRTLSALAPLLCDASVEKVAHNSMPLILLLQSVGAYLVNLCDTHLVLDTAAAAAAAGDAPDAPSQLPSEWRDASVVADRLGIDTKVSFKEAASDEDDKAAVSTVVVTAQLHAFLAAALHRAESDAHAAATSSAPASAEFMRLMKALGHETQALPILCDIEALWSRAAARSQLLSLHTAEVDVYRTAEANSDAHLVAAVSLAPWYAVCTVCGGTGHSSVLGECPMLAK